MTQKLISKLFVLIFVGYATTSDSMDTNNKWSIISESLQAKVKLLPDNCGVPGRIIDKIINGNDAKIGDYPWIALLGYKCGKNTEFNCGGSLINERYVLTAAHCLKTSSNIKINFARFGEWDISSDLDCIENYENKNPECADEVKDIRIQKTIAHPQYADQSLPSLQNDIALIRMAEKIPFSAYIIPICLTPNKFNDSTKYYVAGWGVSVNDNFTPKVLTPILQDAKINLYDFDRCNAMAFPEARPLSDSQFCAGGESSNTCYGDSGGPLQYKSPDTGFYTLKGITSFTSPLGCGKSETPNIYTEVASYITWIFETIEE